MVSLKSAKLLNLIISLTEKKNEIPIVSFLEKNVLK